MTGPDTPDVWWRSRVEAAAMLGVDRRTVARMIAKGQLETRLLGDRSVITLRSIRAVMGDDAPNGDQVSV